MKKVKLLLVFLLAIICITSCNTQKKLTEDITMSVKLEADYENKSFINDGIGEVKLVKTIDGDTSIFEDHGVNIKVRYFGIDTPESTAQIDPWGRPASAYVKEKLQGATNIVLEKDVSSEKTDSTGRYLGLVWIKDNDHQDFYCLNLLLIEQAFSKNHLKDGSSKYLEPFRKAEERARASERRIYGEVDKSIDNSGKIYDVTVQEITQDFEKYNNAAWLRVKGIVTMFVDDNFYLKDTTTDASIYVFSGYSGSLSSWVKVGDEVQFYCKASMYNDTPQLSNVETSDEGEKKFEIISRGNKFNALKLSGNENFEQFLARNVIADLEVKEIVESQNRDFTAVCNFIGSDKKLDIRAGSLYSAYFEECFQKGAKVRVKGCLSRFQPEGSTSIYYQIQLTSQIDRANPDIQLIK